MRRHRMSKSIMHNKEDGTCYICILLHGDYSVHLHREEHHVIQGNPGRKLSEHYGLKVHACIPHHRTGPEAAHKNIKVQRMLQRKAQEAFEEKYSHEKWMEVFGRNYII